MNWWLTYCHPTDEDLALAVRHKLNGDGSIAMLDGAPVNLATIYGRKGLAKREVLAELYPERWHPNNALLCEEDMVIGGNPLIDGTVAHVHTNSDLEISGGPHICGDATASGSIEISGSPTIDGDTASGVTKVWIPDVRAQEYYYMCEYILHDGGEAEDSAGNEIDPDDYGWKWSGGQWKVAGNKATDGAYYIEADVEIAGSPGTAEAPWEATLITEGCIKFTGSPVMEARYGGILIVAEGDEDGNGQVESEPVVELGGTPAQQAKYQGAVLSAGDLKVKGNPAIEGCLVAKGGIPIGGNPTIKYNGARYKFPYVRYKPLAWREK